MQRTRVDSEAIAGVGYEGTTLEVEFTTGRVYRYFDVPREAHEALMRAESRGAYFNRWIRPRYRYEEA
jgi:hypothetical protein